MLVLVDAEIPMRWRNVAFWARTLLAEDGGTGVAGECRVCKAIVKRGDEHNPACSRERLAASLSQIARPAPVDQSSPSVSCVGAAVVTSGGVTSGGSGRPSRTSRSILRSRRRADSLASCCWPALRLRTLVRQALLDERGLGADGRLALHVVDRVRLLRWLA